MKYLFVIISLLFIACCGQKSADTILAEVWDKDQSIRHKIIELTKAVTIDGCTEKMDSLVISCELQERIDAENLAIVEKLLRNGLPKNLSHNSYEVIWIVIDHAPLEKQEQYLPLIKQMADMGLVGADECAILLDRVAMGRNHPQCYGSQIVQFGTPDVMQMYVYPIENPDIVDSLRASVGLSPLVEYLDQVTKTMGCEVKYEPAMTVEQLNELRNN